MSYALGIDVGTSFTAAAVLRFHERSEQATPESLALGTHSASVPSVIHLGEDGQVLVGEAAERRALSSPDRVIRGFTRSIGESVPIIAGDIVVSPQHLYATVVRWVVDRAEEQEGTRPDSICLTHPADWGRYKITLVLEALAEVGLADVGLASEPAAAAEHHAAQEGIETGSTIAVYDLGGGSFDCAILRKEAAGTFTILGRPQGLDRLGGSDFDDAIFRHVTAGLTRHLAGLDPEDPDTVVALSRLRRDCTEAKEALSHDGAVSVPVMLPGLGTRMRLVRSEVEELIGDSIRQSIATVHQALETARLGPEDLTAVILIGGSSRIPLVSELLSEDLRRPIVVDIDPKASVSHGAACIAASRAAAVAAAAITAAAAAAREAAVVATADDVFAPGAAAPSRTIGVLSTLRRSVLATRPTGSDPGTVLGRTSVRLMVVAAAAATTVVVLAGTAPLISDGTGSPIEAAAGADFTRWHMPASPSSATELLFATPAPASPDGSPSADGDGGSGAAPTGPRTNAPSEGSSGTDASKAQSPSSTNPSGSPSGSPSAATPSHDGSAQDGSTSPAGAKELPVLDMPTTTPDTPTTTPDTPTTTPDTQPPTSTDGSTLQPSPEPTADSDPQPDPAPEPEPVEQPEPTSPPAGVPSSSTTLVPEPAPTTPGQESPAPSV